MKWQAITGSLVSVALFAAAAPARGQSTKAQPAPAPRTTVLRIGGNVQQAKLVHRVMPVYPLIAARARVQGTVSLHVIIAADGKVLRVTYISGPAILAKSAMAAVRQWRYKPTLLNGRPIEVDTYVTVVFKLPKSLVGAPRQIHQSLSGGSYRNDTGQFGLTVPEGWQLNNAKARTIPMAIGFLTSTDGQTNLVIQQMPGDSNPAHFAKEINAKGKDSWNDYRKVSESQVTLDGKNCEELTIHVVFPQKVGSVTVQVPTRMLLILVPERKGLLVLNFETLESLFDGEKGTFDKILSSYRSIKPPARD